jgi:hypothetical protein
MSFEKIQRFSPETTIASIVEILYWLNDKDPETGFV